MSFRTQHSGYPKVSGDSDPVDFAGFWMPDRVRHDGLEKVLIYNYLLFRI